MRVVLALLLLTLLLLGAGAQTPLLPPEAPPLKLGMTWPELRKAISLDNLAVSPTDRRDSLIFSQVTERPDLERLTLKVGGIQPDQMSQIMRTAQVMGPSGPETETVFNIARIPKNAFLYYIELVYAQENKANMLKLYGNPATEKPDSLNWSKDKIQIRYLPDRKTLQLTNADSFGVEKLTQAGMTSEEDEVFALTNVERTKNGLAALKPLPQLVEAARGHSTEMLKLGYFDHVSPTPGRAQVWDRVDLTGYKTLTVGENIYESDGYPLEATPPRVVESWMNSPGHRANILNNKYTRMGIGIALKGHKISITQVFSGEPAPP